MAARQEKQGKALMRQAIRNQIRDLEKKIKDLTLKTNQILSLGGIVPEHMFIELEELRKQFNSLQEEQNPLEQQFREEYMKNHAKIQKDLEDLYQRMNAIIKFAEEHGIIFESNLRSFGDEYIPRSFESKSKIWMMILFRK